MKGEPLPKFLFDTPRNQKRTVRSIENLIKREGDGKGGEKKPVACAP